MKLANPRRLAGEHHGPVTLVACRRVGIADPTSYRTMPTSSKLTWRGTQHGSGSLVSSDLPPPWNSTAGSAQASHRSAATLWVPPARRTIHPSLSSARRPPRGAVVHRPRDRARPRPTAPPGDRDTNVAKLCDGAVNGRRIDGPEVAQHAQDVAGADPGSQHWPQVALVARAVHLRRRRVRGGASGGEGSMSTTSSGRSRHAPHVGRRSVRRHRIRPSSEDRGPRSPASRRRRADDRGRPRDAAVRSRPAPTRAVPGGARSAGLLERTSCHQAVVVDGERVQC